MKKTCLLFFALILALILTGCGGNSDTTSSTENTDTQEEESQTLGKKMKDPDREAQLNKQKNLTIGETGDVQGIKITLDKVYLTQSEGYYAEALQPDHIYMVCVYTIQNDSQKNYNPTFTYTTLSANGTVCESTSIETGEDFFLSIPELAPGKNGTGYIAYEVPQDSSQFEVSVKPDVEGTESDNELIFKFDTSQIS